MPAPLPTSASFPASMPRGSYRVGVLLLKRGQHRPVLQDLPRLTAERGTCPTALISLGLGPDRDQFVKRSIDEISMWLHRAGQEDQTRIATAWWANEGQIPYSGL